MYTIAMCICNDFHPHATALETTDISIYMQFLVFNFMSFGTKKLFLHFKPFGNHEGFEI